MTSQTTNHSGRIIRAIRPLLAVVPILALSVCGGHDAAITSPGPVATIALATTAVTVLPAQTLTVSATPRDAAGNSLTGKSVTWMSSQPAVATVDANGVVTALTAGTTTITATIEGKSASVTIAVASSTPPPPPPLPGPDTVSSLGNWSLILDRPLGSKYEGLSFPDSLHGWLIADRGDIIATADGGATWTQQATGLGLLRSVDFIDNLHGFVGNLTGKLYETKDGGATWNNIAGLFPKAPIGFCGITHVGNTVHVVGRYSGAQDYYMSPDGGATWNYTSFATSMGGLVDVAFTSPSVGFISGTGLPLNGQQGAPTILKTTDGGVSWRTVFVNGINGGWAWKIFPINANIIYVSLESLDGTYRVAKSIDGGETWNVQIVATGQPNGTSGGLQGIGFLDENVGWVGGFFIGMFATTNGGQSWSGVPVTSGNVNRYRRVGNTLVTAGTKGVIRYTPRP